MVEMQNEILTINAFPRADYAVTEAMNTLWTNLSYSGTDVKTIGFTSCRPDEGKSFTVMNLARVVAGTVKNVLVLDTDLRRSVLAGRYRISTPSGRFWGMAHYLSGQCRKEDILYPTNYPGLSMALAGHEVLDSFALLDTAYFSDLMDWLRGKFDVILVDTPPVGTIIDAAIISRSCDGMAIVVKENTVTRRELAEAKSQIEKVGSRVLGTVLNDVEFSAHGRKKYYYKSYYKYSGSDYGYYSTNRDAKKK